MMQLFDWTCFGFHIMSWCIILLQHFNASFHPKMDSDYLKWVGSKFPKSTQPLVKILKSQIIPGGNWHNQIT